MKGYRCSGPASGVTLLDGVETLLWPGKTVSLPGEHDYAKVLVTLRHLTPEPEDTKPAVIPAVQPSKRRSSSGSEAKTKDAHGS